MLYGFGQIVYNGNFICCGDLSIDLVRDQFTFDYFNSAGQFRTKSNLMFNRSLHHEITVDVTKYDSTDYSYLILEMASNPGFATPGNTITVGGTFYRTDVPYFFTVSDCSVKNISELKVGEPFSITLIGRITGLSDQF